MELPPYVMLEKAVGQTPLSCMEAWRTQAGIDESVPLTYAGRLDPMASGKLLVLIGEECKKKDEYLGLDKAYDFSVLFGIGSDTHDVLGRLVANSSESLKMPPPKTSAKRAFLGTLAGESQSTNTIARDVQETNLGQAAPEMRPAGKIRGKAFQSQPDLIRSLELICKTLTGPIELPYPHFSSKTVEGKPLHMWTLESRLDEIEIPTKQSTIYDLHLTNTETITRTVLVEQALTKINTIPPVTEERKALGNDFRRTDVRADWEQVLTDPSLPDQFCIAHFHCAASSGTYMRTLAHLIGEHFDTPSLAWSIHRTDIRALR